MGAVTVIAAVVAWPGMGRSEAVVSVWEHRDERPGSVSGDAGHDPCVTSR